MARSIKDLVKRVTEKQTPSAAENVYAKCERLAEMEEELAVQSESLVRQIAELQAKFDTQFGEAQTRIENLENEIKRDVLDLGESIKTPKYQFIFTNGRTTWDAKALEGYMAAGHAELKQFQKEGKASVRVKRTED